MNLKSVILSLASAAVGVVATFATMKNQQPPVEYQNGFSFNTPCMVHGTDTNIVTNSRILRVYEVSVDGEVQGEASAEQIKEVLEVLKTMGVEQPNDTQESRK